MESTRPWLAALEGYYGAPLEPDARAALIRWLAGVGYDAFIHAPKDDPYQRARWRDPYPPDARAHLETAVDAASANGLQFGLTISPGLDWRTGGADVDALTAKVESLLDLGLDVIGIAWDDTPGSGAALGRDHGAAVAEVARRIGTDAARWFTCPVDYAVETPTAYLRAFAGELGDGVELMWTGPSVLTTVLTEDHVRHLRDELGCRLLFNDNFPVNDVGMSQVLHLGPYPEREPAAMALTGGLIANFMKRPLASRIGLELAARAWRDPSADRFDTWRSVVGSVDGLRPLATACSSWLDRPGPDPALARWAEAAGADDRRLREFLEAGCRGDLDASLAAEVEPWLAAWEREASVMLAALDVLESEGPPGLEPLATVAVLWNAARAERRQVFGVRFAVYPSTRRDDGGTFLARPDAIVAGGNLTDLVVERALATAR